MGPAATDKFLRLTLSLTTTTYTCAFLSPSHALFYRRELCFPPGCRVCAASRKHYKWRKLALVHMGNAGNGYKWYGKVVGAGVVTPYRCSDWSGRTSCMHGMCRLTRVGCWFRTSGKPRLPYSLHFTSPSLVIVWSTHFHKRLTHFNIHERFVWSLLR